MIYLDLSKYTSFNIANRALTVVILAFVMMLAIVSNANAYQVENHTYSFSDEVDVYSLPRTNGAIHLGKAKVSHTIEDGVVLEGHYNNKDYRIIRSPLQANSLHIEYDYVHIKHFDCFDITTEDDCYFCYPTKENVVTKLAFATEEIYKYNMKNKQK